MYIQQKTAYMSCCVIHIQQNQFIYLKGLVQDLWFCMMRSYTKLNVEKKCSGTEVINTLNRIRGFNPRPFSSHIKLSVIPCTELKSLIFTIMYRLKNYSQVDQYKSEIY